MCLQYVVNEQYLMSLTSNSVIVQPFRGSEEVRSRSGQFNSAVAFVHIEIALLVQRVIFLQFTINCVSCTASVLFMKALLFSRFIS